MAISRDEILRRLHDQVKAGKPIIGCGAAQAFPPSLKKRAAQT